MQADKLLQLERIKIVMLLDELFEGRIYPSENVFPKTDEFKFVMHESDKLIKYLQERMSKDDSKKMEEFLTQKYNFKDKDADKKIVEQLTLEKDGLSEELFEAKINGILDRIYAHKMAYEIQLFMAESNQVRKDTKEGVLQSALDTFDSSLENLYDKFNNFSEGQ